VTGKRTITTSLMGHVRVEAENAAAALEVISRFCVDPRWLIYLPPTMSPSETSRRPGLLEHPEDAFAYFERSKVAAVIAEQKHMGSRCVLVLARDCAAARDRFGVDDGRAGRIYTRTGRPFFADDTLEQAVIERVANAFNAASLWQKLATYWVCLDAELMPWSAKAQALIADQYQPVGIAGTAATQAAMDVVARAIERGLAAGGLLDRMRQRRENVAAYVRAYEHYIWSVGGIDDLRLAPFHLLASEGAVHVDRPHSWHMESLSELCAADPRLLVATPHRVVDLADAAARGDAIAWWEGLTSAGGEGIVVKPLDVVARGPKGLVQPALKFRGAEYLRVIYGPDYT
jgi:protein phosphatase